MTLGPDFQIDARDNGFLQKSARNMAAKSERGPERRRAGVQFILTQVTEDLVGIIKSMRSELRAVAPAPYMTEALSNRQARRRVDNMDPAQRLGLAKQLGPKLWDMLKDIGMDVEGLDGPQPAP